ncbi:MAG: hypothetical protein ABIQ39_14190 [Ilumatobacteraceae bacterium]
MLPAATGSPPQTGFRPGQLTSGWSSLFIVGWVGVVLGFAAVWKSSWTLGFSTWWLGPESDPRFPVILVLPFILPLAMVAAALRNMRYLPFAGMLTAIATALIAWGDVGRQNRFALVEFALAGGGLLVSVAAIAGMVRNDRRTAI